LSVLIFCAESAESARPALLEEPARHPNHTAAVKSTCDSPERVAAKALPLDLIWHVLALVPTRPAVVWATGLPAEELGNGTVILDPWGLQSARALQSLTLTAKQVHFLTGGKRVVTVGRSGVTIVWDTQTGHRLRELRAQTSWIIDSQVFPHKEWLATLGANAALVIWDASTGKVVRRRSFLEEYRRPGCMRVVLGGAAIAIVFPHSAGGLVVVWDIAEDRVLHELRSEHGITELLGVSRNGTKVAAKAGDEVVMWDVASGQLEHVFRGTVVTVTISHDGRFVAGTANGSVWIWSGVTGMFLRQLATGDGITNCAFLGDRLHLVTVSGAASAVWDVVSGEKLFDLQPARGAARGDVVRIGASADGRLVAACGGAWRMRRPASRMHGTWVMVWDAATGQTLLRSETPRGWTSGRQFCSVDVGSTPSAAGEIAHANFVEESVK